MVNSGNVRKRPNFFIIGAPKCGTTSLALWLGEHPNIYISKPKEPQYFNTDYAAPGRPRSIEEYEMLFTGVTSQHQAIGEASTGYLRSKEAVPSIMNYCPSARFIVCLRNPIDMVRSFHSQLVKMGIETEMEFERAWSLQGLRQCGQRIPKTCYDKKVLLYGTTCQLGQQMKRLFQNVSRDHVLMILLEDMKHDAGNEYRRVLDFLGIDDDTRKHFPVENVRAIPRFPVLSQAVRLVGLAKTRIGWRRGIGFGSIISRLNNRKPEPEALSHEMKAALCDYYKEDIELLGKIMNRDLSPWLEEKNNTNRGSVWIEK